MEVATDSGVTPPPPPEGGVIADASLDADAGLEPLNAISPHDPSGMLVVQQPIDWTIAAAGGAVIRYTTDRTDPVLLSASAPGVATLTAVQDDTEIRWLVVPSSTVHKFLVRVNPALSSTTQGFVDRVSINGGSHIAKVARGATVSGVARTFLWNGSACPSCIDQILVGIQTSESCLTDTNPGTFPGASSPSVSFTVKAPSAPGIYKIRRGFRQEFRCNPDAIGKALGTIELATLIVE